MKSYLYSIFTNFAQKITIGEGDGKVSGIGTDSADDILLNVLNAAYFIAGFIAVVMIIIAGIMYTTSAGNANSVTKAKNMIIYSVAGLVVIILAFAITNFVRGVF